MDDARLFVCARCRRQVLVCSRCDRGQRYCGARSPRAKRQLGAREHRPCGQRNLVPAPAALIQRTASMAPVPGMLASRTNESVGPTPTKQRLGALLLAPVLVHELNEAVALLKLNPIACHPRLPIFQLLGTIRGQLARWMSLVGNQVCPCPWRVPQRIQRRVPAPDTAVHRAVHRARRWALSQTPRLARQDPRPGHRRLRPGQAQCREPARPAREHRRPTCATLDHRHQPVPGPKVACRRRGPDLGRCDPRPTRAPRLPAQPERRIDAKTTTSPDPNRAPKLIIELPRRFAPTGVQFDRNR